MTTWSIPHSTSLPPKIMSDNPIVDLTMDSSSSDDDDRPSLLGSSSDDDCPRLCPRAIDEQDDLSSDDEPPDLLDELDSSDKDNAVRLRPRSKVEASIVSATGGARTSSDPEQNRREAAVALRDVASMFFSDSPPRPEPPSQPHAPFEKELGLTTLDDDQVQHLLNNDVTCPSRRRSMSRRFQTWMSTTQYRRLSLALRRPSTARRRPSTLTWNSVSLRNHLQ
mmetsp:Transcript_8497/g.22343  ORF Transcript_8497/g.22343 Transcript_8497/m.22343 type:complete len:223 (-) Transcript_8497:740-1408(-)